MSKKDGNEAFPKQGRNVDSLDTPDIDFSFITDVPFQRTYANLADIETPEPLTLTTPNLLSKAKPIQRRTYSNLADIQTPEPLTITTPNLLSNIRQDSQKQHVISETSNELLLDLSQRTINQPADLASGQITYGQSSSNIINLPSVTSTITSMSTSTSVSHSESSESTIEFPDFYPTTPSTPAYLQPYKLNAPLHQPEQFRRHSIATTASIPVFPSPATMSPVQNISSETMPAHHFNMPFSNWVPNQYQKLASSKRMHPYTVPNPSTTSTISRPSSTTSATASVPSVETTSSDSNTYIDLIEFKPKLSFDTTAQRRGSFDAQTPSAQTKDEPFEAFMSTSSNPPFHSSSEQTEELINFDNLFTPTASTSMGRDSNIARDHKYYQFRHKNNLASKKFRCSQRDKQKYMDKQIQFYIKDNKKCVELIAQLGKEIEICKKILFKNFRKSDSPEKK